MATLAGLEPATPDRQSSVIPIHHRVINNNMRTSLIVSLIISFLLNIVLLVIAYDADTKAKALQSKYFDLERKANEQFDHANQYALEKYKLLDQLKAIEERTANTKKMLEDSRKQVQEMTKAAEAQNAKMLELNKRIAAIGEPKVCPKPIVKYKIKRIPYDIAPSQQ